MQEIDWSKASEKLSGPLDPRHVKQRTVGSNQMSYIESWYAIDLANQVFGFGGWSSETIFTNMVSEKDCVIGKGGQYEKPGFNVAYVAKVRITVGDVVKEGTGFGNGIDADVGKAHEGAIKEAESDAEKRAFRKFGNPFGLALYDKSGDNVKAPEKPPQEKAEGFRDKFLTVLNTKETTDAVKALVTKHQPKIDEVMNLSKVVHGQIMDAIDDKLEALAMKDA